jgi:transitional endoplasmic reticulum ATPase
MTPAAIVHAVDAAALAACREAAGTGSVVRISGEHIAYALDHRGSQDRPTIEHWSWSRLVLPAHTMAELKEVQTLLTAPDEAAEMGVDAPSGILLTGPPGTGKTTVAKVLAAESMCSFYPVSAADITSRWVGESEQRVARLFNRARTNAPSIIFIDEIDAIGSIRGELSSYDRQLNQLLEEIDGLGSQPGVLVVGATNRPQALDSALVRGGRLSRRIEIPLPDYNARRAMLKQLTARMPLSGVSLNHLATETQGFSGGDLKALCQQAALEAMIRQHGTKGAAAVTVKDFAVALAGHDDGASPSG